MESVNGREQKAAPEHGGEGDRRWIERRRQEEQRNTTAGAGGGGGGGGRRSLGKEERGMGGGGVTTCPIDQAPRSPPESDSSACKSHELSQFHIIRQ